jgi:hypothetical protein
VTPASPALHFGPLHVTLLLPVSIEDSADGLRGIFEVLVRTTPAQVDANVIVLVPSGAHAEVQELLAALSGDISVRPAPELDRAPGSNAAWASAVADAFVRAADDVTTPFLVALDPGCRPDLSDVPDRLTWLQSPTAGPFSHRPGTLATTAEFLRSAASSGLDSQARTPSVELAGRIGQAQAQQPAATVTPAAIEPAAPARTGRTSVIITADAPAATVLLAISSVRRHSPEAELLVVDPGGNRERARALATAKGIRVINPTAAEAAKDHPANAGLHAATGTTVVLLDARAMVGRRWLAPLIDALTEPQIVAAGSRLTLDAGVQWADIPAYNTADAFGAAAESHRRTYRGQRTPAAALDIRCLAFRRDDALAAGGLDRQISRVDLAALDLQLRIAGTNDHEELAARLVLCDEVLVHVSGTPTGTTDGRWQLGTGDLALLRRRHGRDADRLLPGVVAATMIVKNEQARLGRCLESISGVVDDVVICDTGSDDDTVALALALGARVTSFGWCDDFSAARNAALADHVGGWALQVDADDQVVCPDVPALRQQLSGLRMDAVQVVYRTFTTEGRSVGNSIDVLYERLFRADRCEYVGRLHEQVRRRDDGTVGRQARTDLLSFLHDGHREGVWQDKRNRNARINQMEPGADAAGETREPARAEVGHAEVGHTEVGHTELGHTVPEQRAADSLTTGSYGADTVWRAPFEAARIEPDPAVADRLFADALADMPADATWARPRALTSRATYAAFCGRHEQARAFAAAALEITAGEPAASLQYALASAELGDLTSACDALRAVAPAVGTAVVMVDHRIAQVYVPTTLAGLLLGSDDPAGHREAAAILEGLAADYPDVFDAYPTLVKALQRTDTAHWHTRFAAALNPAGDPPPSLPGILAGLPTDERDRLTTALTDRGIVANHATTAAAWARIEPQLRTLGRADVTATAARTEATDPDLALRIWEYVDARTDSSLGRARCLVALDRSAEAAQALTGVDPGALGPADLIFVAVLAAGLGDRSTAAALLDRLDRSLEPLSADVSATAGLLRAAMAG